MPLTAVHAVWTLACYVDVQRRAMTRAGVLVTIGLIAAAVFGQPQRSGAPNTLAGNPKVEVKGRIQSVQIGRGQGTPYLEVRAGSADMRVMLGSVRYLMEQDFNPKAGAEVAVKGYKVGDAVYAITVTLIAEDRTLRLRDADGRPLWQGGRFGRGGR